MRRACRMPRETLKTVTDMARDPRATTSIWIWRLARCRFINNYHVLHGRQEYQDDVAAGYNNTSSGCVAGDALLKKKRHPDHFRRKVQSHWGKNISVSKIEAVGKAN